MHTISTTGLQMISAVPLVRTLTIFTGEVLTSSDGSPLLILSP